MSKKVKASGRARPAAVKPLDPQIGFDELTDAFNVESIAMGMVQLIVDKGTSILYSHFIQDQSEAVTAVDTLDNVLNTVEFQLLPHDQGELLAADEAAHQRGMVPRDEADASSSEPEDCDNPPLWTAEAEPRPCDIDLWASGVVPIKVKPVTPLHLQSGGINALKQDDNISSLGSRSGTISRRSSQSMRSARSIRSSQSTRSSRSTSSRYTSRSSGTRSGFRSRAGSIYGGPGARAGKRGTSFMRINEGPFALATTKSAHELDMDRLRAHELQKMERKRKQVEKKLKLREAGEEEVRRFEKLKAELAGKAYAFDENGEVVLVQAPRSMPTFGNVPKIDVSQHEEEAPTKKKKKRQTQPKSRSVVKKSREPQKREVGFVDLETQPALAEQIALAPGVSLRVGSNIKTGRVETPHTDPARMTFKQYSRMLAGDRAETAEAEAFARPRAVLTPTQAVPNIRVDKIEQNEADNPDRKAAFEAAKQKEEEDALPDIEIIQTPRSEVPEGEEEDDVFAEGDPIIHDGDDFNANLMKDPTWGRNPGSPTEVIHALPIKSEKAYRISSPTSRRGGPRQRPFATNSPEKGGRSRLPPPVFPSTTGHGFQRFGDDQTSRDASLPYRSLNDSMGTRGLNVADTLQGPGTPSPRKAGFFPESPSHSKVDKTDKAKLYFN